MTKLDYFPTLRQLRIVRLYNLNDDDCLSILMDKYIRAALQCPKCKKVDDKWYKVRGRIKFLPNGVADPKYKAGQMDSMIVIFR